MNTTSLIDAWTAEYRPATAAGYRRDIQIWFNWCGRNNLNPLTDANRTHLALYAGWLAATPNQRTRTGRYADASRARLINTVASFYRYATEIGAIDVNPMAGAKKPKADTSVAAMPALTGHDRRAVLETVNTNTGPNALRDRAILAVLAYLGVRASELCGFTVPDYEWRTTKTGWVRALHED